MRFLDQRRSATGLDSPQCAGLRPTVHFWTRTKQPWVALPEGDQRFETQPADMQAFLYPEVARQ
jgi:hypothetical protein